VIDCGDLGIIAGIPCNLWVDFDKVKKVSYKDCSFQVGVGTTKASKIVDIHIVLGGPLLHRIAEECGADSPFNTAVWCYSWLTVP